MERYPDVWHYEKVWLGHKIGKGLYWLDCWANDKLFGRHWGTISGRLGVKARAHGGKIPWKRWPVQAAIHWFLEKIDPGHSERAIKNYLKNKTR